MTSATPSLFRHTMYANLGMDPKLCHSIEQMLSALTKTRDFVHFLKLLKRVVCSPYSSRHIICAVVEHYKFFFFSNQTLG